MTAEVALRVVSFDVGTTHLGIWAGEFRGSTERPHERFPFRFDHWELLDLGTQQLHDVTEQLHRELDRRPFLSDPQRYDWVLIENQIDDVLLRGGGGRGRNVATMMYKVGRMKSVGAVIHSYFYAKRATAGAPANILYVSPRGKLKVYRGSVQVQVRERASEHERNKAIAVAHVRALLNEAAAEGPAAGEMEGEGRALLDWFWKLRNTRGYLKRDDVADAFLQAAYWCIARTGWRQPDPPSTDTESLPPVSSVALDLSLEEQEDDVDEEGEQERAAAEFAFDMQSL